MPTDEPGGRSHGASLPFGGTQGLRDFPILVRFQHGRGSPQREWPLGPACT